MLLNHIAGLLETRFLLLHVFASEKHSVWDRVLGQTLVGRENHSEEVVFPSHVAWVSF